MCSMHADKSKNLWKFVIKVVRPENVKIKHKEPETMTTLIENLIILLREF